MNLEAVIGLEIHVQMKTKSKMFSSAPVTFGKQPNTSVSAYDIAFPGTMPTVNKQAVVNGIRVCHTLHMIIDNELWFDRKNYFYSDLSKGYQLTQQNRPLGKNGYLKIETSSCERVIHIDRLHLEEDTCKQLHFDDYTLLDYNRSGIPLVEIVTTPEIKSGEEALKFVEKIRSIVTFLEVSSGKMEEGSLRCDVNVSIRPIGAKDYGTKVEIKNINTLTNIQEAIDYEISRQESILLSGGIVEQETRRFDEVRKVTALMRRKTDEIDYKCFTDGNIIPIRLSEEFIKSSIDSSPELAEEKTKRYIASGLSEYQANQFVNNKEISDYYDEVVGDGANQKLAANWILVDVQSVLNKQNIAVNEFKISPSHLAELIVLIDNGKLSNKQARDIFNIMLINDESPNALADDMDMSQINNENEIQKLVIEVLDNNPQAIIDYKQGKDRVIGFLVGQVIQLTKGKGNPSLIKEILLKEMKVR